MVGNGSRFRSSSRYWQNASPVQRIESRTLRLRQRAAVADSRRPRPATRSPLRLRHTPSSPSEKALQAIMDPRRLLRWIYIGRMSVASAIFVAAVFSWFRVDEHTTLLSSLALVVSTIVTAVSAGYTSANGGALSKTFLYLQFITDLLL